MIRAAAIGAYLAALLAVDTQVGYGGQLALGVLTWAVLGALLVRIPVERRVQTLGVVAFATVGEVTGSLVWGVYSYRLHNLPLFIPPAHGLVFLAGLSLAAALRERWIVRAAAVGAVGWGLAGLTVLPRLDVAGAIGVPLLCVFLWRSRARGTYAAVFLVVAALELYGTAIGTWRWAESLPGLGVPDGNPPSGVASGYVWFDVMALLVASRLGAVGISSIGSTGHFRRTRVPEPARPDGGTASGASGWRWRWRRREPEPRHLLVGLAEGDAAN